MRWKVSSGQQRKGARIAVRERSVGDALRDEARLLTSEEERSLRLLHGVAAQPDMELERKTDGDALAALYAMEAELHRRYAEHLDRPTPQPSEAKDRIIRALRRKR